MKKINVRIKNTTKSEVKNNIDNITKNALEYAMLTYEQEESREQSLITQSTQMITYFSFVSILVLTIIPVVVDTKNLLMIKYLICTAIPILLLLFTSMFLAVIAQWRYKYQSLDSPISIFNHIIQNVDSYKSESQRNKSFIQTLDSVWQSKRKNSNKRVKLLRSSMILFFVAIGMIITSIIYGTIFFM